jgi:DNA ligase (NAD+)
MTDKVIVRYKNKAYTVKTLFEFLSECAKIYYSTGKKKIGDEVFDKLQKIYEKHSGKKLPVGGKVEVGNTLSLSHSYEDFAGTLYKTKSPDEVYDWMRRKGIKPQKDNIKIAFSLKADGHSITVETKYNKKTGEQYIDKALTRGRDGVGKDLTPIFKEYEYLLHLPVIEGKNYAVGYEAVMTYDNFNLFHEQEKETFNNPRSIIGAVLSDKGNQYFHYISLLALRIKTEDDELSRIEALEYIDEINTTQNEQIDFSFWVGKVSNKKNKEYLLGGDDYSNFEEALENFYQSVIQNREEINIMIDGIVIEVLNEDIRQSLGYTDYEPNFAAALKFPPAEKETTVEDVKWSVEGTSGRYTPVVHFKPVSIDNNSYTKVSVANYQRFKNLNLHKGDSVLFTRRNDVLGYIEKLDEDAEPTGEAFKAPKFCIHCGERLSIVSVFLECTNPACKTNELGNILQFIDVLKLKFIGKKTVEKLYDNKIISKFSDFFELTEKDFKKIKSIDGLGNHVIKLINQLVDKLTTEETPDYLFLGAFNIPLIRDGRAEKILKDITLPEIIDLIDSKDNETIYRVLSNTNNIGMKIVDELAKALGDEGYYRNELGILYENMNIVDSKIDKSTLGEDFVPLTFVHTGNAKPFKTRDEIKRLIATKGHSLVGSVSNKTNFLINNDVNSTTDKNKKAKELGIPIITVEEFMAMMNG